MARSSTDSRRQRLLPFDVTVTLGAPLGDVFKVGKVRVPPSYDELANAGLVAPEGDADRWFSPEEQLTAAWLRDRELAVRSVRRREGRYLKTPDAAAPEFAVTIEVNRAAATINAIVQRIRSARWQARHVVADLRGSGASRGLAESAMRAALRMYSTQLDEAVLIVVDDLGGGWSHG